MSLIDTISEFPVELQTPLKHLVDDPKKDLGVTRVEFNDLKEIVRELAQAQKRTEERVEELAQAQKETQNELNKFAKEFRFQIEGLGSRWGNKSEASFRNGLR